MKLWKLLVGLLMLTFIFLILTIKACNAIKQVGIKPILNEYWEGKK